MANDGSISVVGELVESGGIGADPGAQGSFLVGPAGTLIATGFIAASQILTEDLGGLIEIAHLGSFAGTISGFTIGDRIEVLNDLSISAASYSGSDIVLFGKSGVVGTVAAANATTPAQLVVSNDGTNTFVTAQSGRTLSRIATNGGTFGSAANWNDVTDGLDPAQSAPASNDTVQFNSSGGAFSGSGFVAAAAVGSSGSGVMQMSGGATLTAGMLDVAGAALAIGQAGLTGAATGMDVVGTATVGDGGTGVLSVLNDAGFAAAGLTVGSQAESSGTLLVAGAGAVATVSGPVMVGAAGAGAVRIGAQGTLLSGETASVAALGIEIGQASGGSGSIVVAGTGARLVNEGAFVVGGAGVGALAI